MALKVEKPGRCKEYILHADRESSNPTVFEYRSLMWEEMAEVNEHAPMTTEQAVQIAAIMASARAENRELMPEESARIAEIAPINAAYMHLATKQAAVAVRHGITRIRNLVDLDGNPIEMNGAEFAKYAPGSALRELGQEIIRNSRLEEDLIKK